MAMTNSDKLHVEPAPVGWTAYYDPEGLHGDGASRADALEDLLEQTDEAWRKALDERDAAKLSFSEEQKKVDTLRESMRLDAETIAAKDAKIAELEGEIDEAASERLVALAREMRSTEYAEQFKWLTFGQQEPEDKDFPIALARITEGELAIVDARFNLGGHMPREGDTWTHWMPLPEVTALSKNTTTESK
jgi:hypothetical protein